MRMKFSEEAERLRQIVSPYIIRDKLEPRITPDAPAGIEELYKEYIELTDKEYMHAINASCGFLQPTE